MKRIYTNIVEVEDGDTLQSISLWIDAYKKISPGEVNTPFDVGSWVVLPKPGDLIIFNSTSKAMYRLAIELTPISDPPSRMNVIDSLGNIYCLHCAMKQFIGVSDEDLTTENEDAFIYNVMKGIESSPVKDASYLKSHPLICFTCRKTLNRVIPELPKF